MLQEKRLRAELPLEGMGVPLHFFQSLPSTNDYAKRLAEKGAPHGTLVTADEQTAGHGRRGRRWVTKKGAGLAISLVLRPDALEPQAYARLTGLGALAVVDGLEALGLAPSLKWPNDVLLGGRKVAGVLAEAVWKGAELDFVVLGMGVNVRRDSIPDRESLDYPSGFVDAHTSTLVDRESLLLEIVRAVGSWAKELRGPALPKRWQDKLAFIDREIIATGGSTERRGTILGLTPQGALKLRTSHGEIIMLAPDYTTIRPVDSELN